MPAVKNALLVLYALFAGVVALTTLSCICLAYHVGPFRDLWIAMDFIRGVFEGTASFNDLFSLHGGSHRLAVPRLLFLVEYGVFSGSNVFLIALSLLTQVSVVWLMARLLQTETHLSQKVQRFLIAVTVVLMLNGTQLENFLYTFDIQWFITSAAAFWALAFWQVIFRNASQDTALPLTTRFAALLFTAISLFSSFSGLCVCLVLPFMAIAYRVPIRQFTGLLFAAVVVIALYVQGPFAEGGNWQAPEHVTPLMVLKLLGYLTQQLLLWTGLYFGSPLSRWNTVAGFIFSYGSLLFLFYQWFSLLNQDRKDVTEFQRLMLGLALWAAFVGIATGMGRMYFVHTAPEDRYQSIVLMYWLGLFGFMLSRALQIQRTLHTTRHTKKFSRAAFSLIGFWTLIVIPLASFHDDRTQLHFFDRVNNADLAIATGQWDYNDIKDTLILGDKWKKINRVEKHGSFLRDKQWGVFAEPDVRQLGTTLDVLLIDTAECDGQIYAASHSPSPYRGLRLQGRGVDTQAQHPFKQLVIVDENNRQVGLARLQRPKDFWWPLSWQNAEASHWLGYTIDLSPTPHTLRVLGVRDTTEARYRYCQVAALTVPDTAFQP